MFPPLKQSRQLRAPPLLKALGGPVEESQKVVSQSSEGFGMSAEASGQRMEEKSRPCREDRLEVTTHPKLEGITQSTTPVFSPGRPGQESADLEPSAFPLWDSVC